LTNNAPEKPKANCYSPLAAARRMVKAKAITGQALADAIGLPLSTVNSMIQPGYSNKTLDAVDAIRDAVREFRANLPKKA